MAIPYCDVHERLFDGQRNAWIPWSRLDVKMGQGLGAMLEAEPMPWDDDHVTPMWCDRCIHIARQAVDAHIEPGDQSP